MGSSLTIKCHHNPQKPSSPIHFFTLLCIFLLNVAAASKSDKSALMKFKNSVSDPFGVLWSWNSSNSDHCSWFGVSCGLNSRVVSLNITGGGNLRSFTCSKLDEFPLFGYGTRKNCVESNGILVGNFPPAVSKLTELRVLWLPFNGFTGEIPRKIWGMKNLAVLDLEGNSINGSLPVSFSGLRRLRVLYLGFNMIGGEIPNSLSNCAVLEVLNLAGNQLNGTVPAFIGGLRSVYLSFNILHGTIPGEIGNKCKKLEHLDLSGNSSSHRIPSTLGNCSQLRLLSLHSNMLEVWASASGPIN